MVPISIGTPMFLVGITHLVSTFPADGTPIPVGVCVGMLLVFVMSIVAMVVVVVAVKKKAAHNQKRKMKIRGNTVVLKQETEVKK